jgi:DnaJ-class molecular chaperone
MNISVKKKSYAPERCAWCEGTGRSATSASRVISCLVCGGKGKISVTQPAEQCRKCDGAGRRSATLFCLTCVGTGWSPTI